MLEIIPLNFSGVVIIVLSIYTCNCQKYREKQALHFI